MTPPATAAAAPRLAPGSRRRAPARPRRVSGPAPSGRATTAAVAVPAPGVALPRRRAATPKRRPVRSHEPRGIALRVIDAVEGISSSSLLDRLIRGRLWIGLLAFALIGIVAMQLLVLELNTGIGRKLARVAQLQIANSQLGIEDSGASAEARIDPLATASGMTFAPSGSVHFVAAAPADVAHAAAALSTVVKAPVAGSAESVTAESSEASASSQVAETTTSSETSASTPAESGSGEASSEAHETPAPPSGQTASSASSSEVSAGSSESEAAASPTGAGGGVQASVGE